MQDAIRKMRDFADGMTLEKYRQDAKTRLAVERCVEIISEAARRIPREIQEEHPTIPWDDIEGIGNILRHGYDAVDDRIIWGVLKRHLTALEGALALIAARHGSKPR
jgi:uncharacterized protein with HEPN domain